MAREQDVSSILVQDLTDLKAQTEVLSDVLNVMDWALDSALEQMKCSGQLPPEDGLLEEYRAAIKVLRQRGFRHPPPAPGQGVQCPSCQALLKNLSGAAGERCGWCGHVFG